MKTFADKMIASYRAGARRPGEPIKKKKKPKLLQLSAMELQKLRKVLRQDSKERRLY